MKLLNERQDLWVTNQFIDDNIVTKDIQQIGDELEEVNSIMGKWETTLAKLRREDSYYCSHEPVVIPALEEKGYEFIDSGSIGMCYRKTIEGREYLIKMFVNSDIYGEEEKDYYTRDCKLLEVLNSYQETKPYYPSAYGEVPNRYCIVEFIDGEEVGDIENYSEKGNTFYVYTPKAREELCEILRDTIEVAGYCPADLHCGNILYRNNSPVIIDVGEFDTVENDFEKVYKGSIEKCIADNLEFYDDEVYDYIGESDYISNYLDFEKTKEVI